MKTLGWQKGLFYVTQWMFIISVIWFTIGLVIVGSDYWYILPLVPLLGIIAVGYILELKIKTYNSKSKELNK
jgi:4-hydroxybenzoate polyprenyltransferase